MQTPSLKGVFVPIIGATCLTALFVVGVFAFMNHSKGDTKVVEVEEVTEKKDAFASVPLSAKAAIVYDVTTDTVLFGKQETTQLPLASIAKLLVVYEALHTLTEENTVTITPSALLPEGDSGFYVGEQFEAGELARLALVASSNDASAALRETVEARGSRLSAASFLSQTYLINGTGLDESGDVAGAYGSAKDVALLLARFHEEFPGVLEDTTHASRTYHSLNGDVHTVKNTDLIAESIPRFLGGKTGLTDLAGGNLGILFDAGMGRPVAIVVLGATEKSRFTDVSALLFRTQEYFAETTLYQ